MDLSRSDLMEFFTVEPKKTGKALFIDRIWWKISVSQKCHTKGPFFDRFWGQISVKSNKWQPEWPFFFLPAEMVLLRSDLMKKKFGEIQKWQPEMAVFDRIWWKISLNSKNGSRNGPFSIGFDEFFYGINPKMAAGMALFRSDLMQFFTVKTQKWQPEWSFLDRILWKKDSVKSVKGNRNGNFSIGFDEKNSMKKFDEIHEGQPKWSFFVWIWWNFW